MRNSLSGWNDKVGYVVRFEARWHSHTEQGERYITNDHQFQTSQTSSRYDRVAQLTIMVWSCLSNLIFKSWDGVAPDHLQHCSSTGNKRASKFLNSQRSSETFSRSERVAQLIIVSWPSSEFTGETRTGAFKSGQFNSPSGWTDKGWLCHTLWSQLTLA